MKFFPFIENIFLLDYSLRNPLNTFLWISSKNNKTEEINDLNVRKDLSPNELKIFFQCSGIPD